ncbi:MAG TPA: hypothetical protein VN700_03265 [Vicinamibacterales bacterium]|nr:hypothetical protein [Vicinamibacterales bacterium]
MTVLARSTAIWSGILVIAIANGAFRQGILIPRLGDAVGHVISTLMLSAAVIVVAWLTIGWIGPTGDLNPWGIGIYWFALTVAFEFLAGHYLFGTPWPVILSDYNVLKGRIWPLVLLATLVAPALATRVRL